MLPFTKISQCGSLARSIRRPTICLSCRMSNRHTRRRFAQVADVESRDKAAKPALFAGTVLTRNPTKTSVQELVDSISPTALLQEQDKASSPLLLALLLTPSFAHQALESDIPLRILQRLQGEAQDATKDLHTFTAVVDKLPSVQGPSAGLEGLSYFFVRNLRSTADSPFPVPLNATAEKPGSLTFDVSTNGTDQTQYQVQLPLAHTVFSTGLPSTLQHHFYRYNSQTRTLDLDKSNYLESASIGLPSFDYETIHFPLVPLTPFREVKTSMGNIIRTLSSIPTFDPSRKPQEEVSSQPASQELEAVISQYFKALDRSPEPIEVWALIVPSQSQTPGRTSSRLVPTLSMRKYDPSNIPPMWGADIDPLRFMEHNEGIRQALIGGGRLCKVLSGGGGWGKKAGLLSLDPDTAYSTRTLRGDTGWEFDFTGDSPEASEKQKRQALGEIVKEGESIMFLVQGRGKFSLPSGDAEEAAVRSVVFGPIPSTMDVLPDNEGGVSAGQETELIQQPGLFGALSETGLAVTIRNPQKPGAAAVQSKIDTPFSLFCAHARVEEEQ